MTTILITAGVILAVFGSMCFACWWIDGDPFHWL